MDGQAHYWSDKRLSRPVFSKRQKGEGGIIVWAAMSHRGKTKLVFVENTINAKQYLRMLDDILLPFIAEYYPKGATFQQDGAPSHSFQHTRDFFADSGITDLP